MTKKQLLKKLIAHYTKAGEEMTRRNWMDKIFKYNVHRGICYCADHILNASIRDEQWVKYWVRGYWSIDGFWYNPSSMCDSLQEALETLEYRIFIMTMELESGV